MEYTNTTFQFELIVSEIRAFKQTIKQTLQHYNISIDDSELAEH